MVIVILVQQRFILWTLPGLQRNCCDKIPWFFHDLITKFHDLLIDILVENPWLFQKVSKFQKIHDFSMTVATLHYLYVDIHFRNYFCNGVIVRTVQYGLRMTAHFGHFSPNPWVSKISEPQLYKYKTVKANSTDTCQSWYLFWLISPFTILIPIKSQIAWKLIGKYTIRMLKVIDYK